MYLCFIKHSFIRIIEYEKRSTDNFTPGLNNLNNNIDIINIQHKH